MRIHTLFSWLVCITASLVLIQETAFAQANQYKRKKTDETQVLPAPGTDGKPADAGAPPAPTGDKLDITDLEQKYWSAKDTDFSVVQNRTYTKEKRYSLSASMGPIVNDAYSKGFGFALTGNYFFSEREGVQLEYTTTNLSNSKMVEAFAGNYGGVIVDHNKVKTSIGASYNYVPVYAKVSLLGKKILYFDMIFSPGVAIVNYEQNLSAGNEKQQSVALTFDVSQMFFLSSKLAIRADLKNRWYQHNVRSWRYGSQISSDTEQNFFLMFGVTYFH
jgi:outer membrane beta-barrel protein